MKITHLESTQQFQEKIKDKCIVDFYADWCGPCKMLSPILEKTEGPLEVIKINVDNYEEICREYGIMSIPTLIIFENGKPIKKNIGFMSSDELEKFIK